jgi:hypothetical protein
MRLTNSLAAVAALLPTVLAAGAFVQNWCPFAVSYYGDYNGAPASDVQGTIAPGGGTYFENYVTEPGRALKFYEANFGQSNLLVWGYNYDSTSPFIW